MSTPFVWFHNGSETPADSVAFYEKLLGWKGSDGPPGMTMAGDGRAGVAGGVARFGRDERAPRSLAPLDARGKARRRAGVARGDEPVGPGRDRDAGDPRARATLGGHARQSRVRRRPSARPARGPGA